MTNCFCIEPFADPESQDLQSVRYALNNACLVYVSGFGSREAGELAG